MTTPRVLDGGPLTSLQVTFPGTIAVAAYDLMFSNGTGFVPASEQADQLSESLNQQYFASRFAGLALQNHPVTDTVADTAFPIATDGNVEFDCASATFEVGDLVGACETSGGTSLENQKVKKVTSQALAIGVVTKRYASATTRVRFRVVSRVLPAALIGADMPGAVNGTGVAVVERPGTVQTSVFTLTATSITMTDATTNGCHGSQKIYDFPEGNITILGATMNLTTLAGSGGIADTAALIGSLGTVANTAANETLTSTEADIIPSTSGTLAAGAGTLKGESTTALLATFDGTATAKDLYLNIAVPDAGSSADDTVAVTGTIVVTWINHGDN